MCRWGPVHPMSWVPAEGVLKPHSIQGISMWSLRGRLPGRPEPAQPCLIPAPSSSGLTEDGLPGPGGQTHQDFVLNAVEWLAFRRQPASLRCQAADGRRTVSPPGTGRGGGQW